ncbi:hypothetical protein IW261DRAFT_1483470 [Armillaria novae-zelandiae]|uniref:Uncharacterized protein n=1 Tax=Armillaria novae-zelandiae TaxID=153914 RepID=A0AA39UDP8_9AGAR|nr:hypothetical protein IW261DRAFT_1483470 [Armillaria novae-zelandiae]
MPTSTVPYEVLFDFTNDTDDLVTLQPMAQSDGVVSRGAILLMKEGDSVSLVLTAGCTYQYALKHRSKKAYISVRTWQDLPCSTSMIFSGTLPSTPLLQAAHGSNVSCTISRE